MADNIPYQAVEDAAELVIDESYMHEATAPANHGFITRIYAVFTGFLLLIVLFVILFAFNPGLVEWMLGSGRFLRFSIFLLAVVSASYLGSSPGHHARTLPAVVLFAVCQAHEVGLFVVLDTSELLQRIALQFLFVTAALTVASKFWPKSVQRIPHFLLSSPAAFPLVMALLTMMSFTYLQIEACNLVADIMFVLLVVYYSESIVVEYSGDQVFAAATALYRDVVLRVGLGLLCVGVVVSRF